jgi:hypothetical protein
MKIQHASVHHKSFRLVAATLIISLTGIIPFPAFAEKTLGVGVHLQKASPEQVIEQLNLARELGVTAIRMDVAWAMVENEAGDLSVPTAWDTLVDEAQKRGIHCLFILDYGHPRHGEGSKPVTPVDVEAFARYAEYIVRYFRGRVSSYEIWNEWDMNVGGSPPGNAQDYVRLVRMVYPRLKAVDPGATILAGGASGLSYGNNFVDRLVGLDYGSSTFFSETLSNGLLNHVDGLSVHIYVYWKKGTVRTHEGALAVLDGIRETIKSFQPVVAVPIHVTEVGWTTTYQGTRVFSTPEEQAKFLAAFTDGALSRTDVDSVYLYELKDGNSLVGDIEGNFGLVDAQGRKKPACETISKVASRKAHSE